LECSLFTGAAACNVESRVQTGDGSTDYHVF
jgi:hypothetical protein